MRLPFSGLLRWIMLLALCIGASGAPLLTRAQTATPGASPEAVEERDFQVVSSSSSTILSPDNGAVLHELFLTELVIDPGGVVPGHFQHFGIMTISVLSGAICYTIEEAPSATMSTFASNSADETSDSMMDCAPPSESCTAICEVSPGAPVLVRAGESITHIIPAEVEEGEPGGVIHSYVNVDAVPARVVVIEYGGPQILRSCHGGCY
jgi:hypothetical protein